MRTNKLFSFFVLGLLMLSANSLFAQFYTARVTSMGVQPFASTFSSIVGTGEVLLGSGDDNVYSMSLPFNFNYDNTAYAANTTLYAGTNGFICFGRNPGSGCCSSNLGNSSFYGSIMLFQTDMYVTGKLCYVVTGSAPNRVLTFEWNNIRGYSGSTGTNMQVKMYETKNFIEFLYETAGLNMTNSGGVGLNGTNSPSFIYATYQTATTTPSNNIRWTTPIPPNNQLSTSPKSLNYGSQFTGVATYGIVNASHVGTESTLQINAVSIGGPNASDFTVTAGPPVGTNLAIGQTVQYTIQFIPTFGGARSATLTIATNGRDSGTQTISLTGLGIAPLIQVTPSQIFKLKRVVVNDTAEQSIIISSVGQASLFFSNYPNSFPIIGDAAGDYIISKLPMNPLPPGGTDTLKVKFIPKAEGARFAEVDINTNAQNAASVPVLLKGIGIIPRITVSPTYLDYDSTDVTATTCSKITVSNPGSDTLRITNHYFTSNDNDFSFTPLTGQQLVVAPNASVDVNICFTPLQKGTRQARFRVTAKMPKTIEQSPRDTNFVDVDIRGNATPLDKSIIAIKDFSNDPVVGEEGTTTLELSNVGTDPVVVKAPVITGANASEFTVSKVNFPITVAPGNSISMTVTAKPMARGERNANIAFNLTTSEGTKYSVNADVKATALLASASCVATGVSFDKLLLGETITKTVEISNNGDIDQTLVASLTGSDAFSLDNTAIEVLKGAKGTYTVTFAPKTEGLANASLTIKGSHIADMTVALNGTGEKKPDVTQSVGKVSEMDGFSLEQNAPNPAVGYTNFTFTAPKQSNVRLYLADMSGKVVKEVANSSFSGGKHSISMDTKELASGSYVYILESGATRIMRQMVVTK